MEIKDSHHVIKRIKQQSKKVDFGYDTACWVWNGSTCRKYGTVKFMGKLWYAHRLSWTLLVGPIKSHNRICHKCDNPPCVNPDHLFDATQLENMRDAKSKKRLKFSYGEKHGMSKLTEGQVLEIRRRYKPWRITMRRLANEFGVSQHTICLIISRQTWSHI